MKRIVTIILSIMMVLILLVGCGGSKNSTADSGDMSSLSNSGGEQPNANLKEMEIWLEEHEMSVEDMVMMGSDFITEVKEGATNYMSQLVGSTKGRDLSSKEQKIYDRFTALLNDVSVEAYQRLNGRAHGIPGSECYMNDWMYILNGKNDNWVLEYVGDTDVESEDNGIQMEISIDGQTIMTFDKSEDQLCQDAYLIPSEFPLTEYGASLEPGEYTATCRLYKDRNLNTANYGEDYVTDELRVVVK